MTYLINPYLLNFYLYFFSFCISFNGVLGSTVSGVCIVTEFSVDFDEINDFIKSFFTRSSSRRKYTLLLRLSVCS